jgi:hypothetical protein
MPLAHVWANSRTCFRLILALGLGLALPAAVFAGTKPAGFTNASLQGQYALVGIGDGHVAASVGVNSYDGKGNAQGGLTLNTPGTGQTRTIVKLTSVGTYTVNADGTGTATMTMTLPDGKTFSENFDFVITEATLDLASATKRATEVFLVQREPGIAVKLVTFVLKGLPE